MLFVFMASLISVVELSAKSILEFEVRFRVWPLFKSRLSQFHSLDLAVVSMAFCGRNIAVVVRSVCTRFAEGALRLRRKTSVHSKVL